MGEVNSHGESWLSERHFRPACASGGEQPTAENSGIPGLLRADLWTERASRKMRVGGATGAVVEPSLRDISMAYNNIFPDGNVGNHGFSKVPADTARGLQRGLRSGPRAGRQHQRRGAPRPRHRRYDSRSRPPLVPSRPRSTSYALADAGAIPDTGSNPSHNRAARVTGAKLLRAVVWHRQRFCQRPA
jgi:hypothetical protein